MNWLNPRVCLEVAIRIDSCSSQNNYLSQALMFYAMRNTHLDPSVKNLYRRKTFVYAVLLFWVLASISGIHGHYCFDGQEPPVSVHSDVMVEHPEHHDDERHVDADVDLFKLVIAKLVKIDVPLLLTALVCLLTLSTRQQHFFSRYFRLYSRRVIGLRPPLRAPPVLPA